MDETLLYPARPPYNKGFLKTADGEHELYYEEYGNPDGIPLVMLHGGPGAGFGPYFPRLCDNDAFRIVVYDQRGAPKSRPAAKIEHNSPDLLVEDNEQLRKDLGIDKWHVFGGSWGSTLSLLYAESYPKQVLSLTLRGVFTMRQQEIDWYIKDMNKFYPELKAEFESHIPLSERDDLLDAYFNRVADPDPAIHEPAAYHFVRNETGCAHLDPLPDEENQTSGKDALPFARMEAHFFRNYGPDDRIMKNLHRIKDIPTMIVQGRYDIICPPQTAYEVSQKLDQCNLVYTKAGHSATEPETMKELVAAMDRIRDTGTPLPPRTGPATHPAPAGP